MTARRGAGEGSIFFDASRNRYVGTIDLGPGTDGRRRRPKVSARTKTEVRAKLAELRRRADDGLPTGSGEQLGAWLEWWLGTLEARAASQTKSVNTVDNARWAVNHWIVPALGSKRLRDLQPEDVERLLANMAASGLARSSVTRIRFYLAQALGVAERRGRVHRNVARLAELPETKPSKAARRSLNPDQARALLAATAGDRLEALFVVGLFLGLRPGELTGLVWADVDFDTGVLRVDGSMKRERGEMRRGDTKTPKSRRPLAMPARVKSVLMAHRERQDKERARLHGVWPDTDLVFTTEVGTPLDPSNLRRSFDRVTARAGIGVWTPNELRHSAATLLSEAGVPLEVIADVLGHTSTRMLEQHYRHRTKPAIDAQVQVMDELFGDSAS